ncbi:MAG: 2-oxoacid:acceptor oxidoreductase family protein [Bacillota bacterium]
MQEVLIAGFGGQGIMSLGQLLTYAGMAEGKQVSWMPSYGPEQRGGAANCSVVLAQGEDIGSPIVSEPDAAIVMNAPSLEKFEPAVRRGGVLVVNSSLSGRPAERKDITALEIPATDLANEMGNVRVAGMIALGALVELTGMVSMQSLADSLPKVLKASLVPLNMEALGRGQALAREGAPARAR